ncbi:NAD(P)-dependent oxidoreductase [Demequina pelophila]|uniref:NAD(P)-dependent oxidoreductase n=1 Tax=Demequina pelophila TaxID=1638984 RepID=UPI0007842397|nr:NAD(P)-dependent oxidoreductase [Demequina pelophila]
MITVAVPSEAVADALGDLGEDARTIVWDPVEGEVPEAERERVTIACLPHGTGGRRVYGRLAECPDLKVIQLPSAGFEHAVPFVPPGVALANARGVHDTRVAEMALALALASQRRLPQFLDAQRRGAWEPDYWSPKLADSRALVVGYGAIGAAIGARFRACEVEVEGVARTARTAPDGTVVHAVDALPGVLGDFDVVVIVTPHDESTDRLVDAAFLAAMRDDALLINVGRGRVVDTDALVAELRAGRLRAALDVTDPEPLPEGHPLWDAPGCIVVPHVAGWERLTDRRYADLVRRQVEARRHGDDPVNFVMMGAFPA